MAVLRLAIHPFEGVSAPGDRGVRLDRLGQDEGDRRRVLDLVARVAGANGRGPQSEVESLTPRAAAIWAEMASSDRRRVTAWLASRDGFDRSSAVGLVSLVASLTAAGTRHSIAWLLVDPDQRRLGIGRRLAAEACRTAWIQGAERVWADTHSGWPAAVAFWRAVGFEPVPRRP